MDQERCGLTQHLTAVSPEIHISLSCAQARDEQGNKRLCGGDSFVVRLEGSRTVTGSVEDCGDGTYTASYITAASGSYQLHITNGMRLLAWLQHCA